MTGQATIYALSSGRPPSAVAIVRVSGPAARFVAETISGADAPTPRRASLRRLRDPEGGLIDEALVIWWPGPASFTGEDCVEFHLHGSRAVVARLMDVLGAIPGCRPAEPGEFTRLAFLNGRMDLMDVEGLGDLIAAETEAQRRGAMAQLGGRFREHCEGWRRQLLEARAWIEAEIDFADEADVPEAASARAWATVAALAQSIREAIDRAGSAERLREGLVVVLIGAPNAGKSSLLNALARRDVAIVSEEAGTTRDLIEVDLDIGGYPVRLIDTAGLREAAGAVEREGIRRARARAAQADVILALRALDGSAPVGELHGVAGTVPVWPVLTKADLDPEAARAGEEAGMTVISVHRPETLSGLEGRLADHAGAVLGATETGFVLHDRQRRLLISCVQALEEALKKRAEVELAGEELRRAGDALAAIAGRISTEDVLGEIFARFCIGK